MKSLRYLIAVLLSVVLSAAMAFAHAAHDKEAQPVNPMQMVMDTPAPAPGDGFIRFASPAGNDIVLGRKNPLNTLEYTVVIDDKGRKVKVFEMTVDDVKFEIYPGKTLAGWGFNKSIPGPTIRVTEGDRIRINLTNKTKDEHTLHIHGQTKPMIMDGVPYLGQSPIKKDETYTYEFTVLNPGTHWYHCHVDGGHHVAVGMYGAFIVSP